jgi:hypothetical protein
MLLNGQTRRQKDSFTEAERFVRHRAFSINRVSREDYSIGVPETEKAGFVQKTRDLRCGEAHESLCASAASARVITAAGPAA